jgi:hypothetical protein
LPADLSPETCTLLEQLDRWTLGRQPGQPSAQTRATQWEAAASGSALSTGVALEALAWCHALPGLAEALSEEVWRKLLDRLCTLAAQARSLTPDGDLLVPQLLAGELGLTLAYLFPKTAACRPLAKEAREVTCRGLRTLIGADGLPHGKCWRQIRPLVASWTRTRAILGAMPKAAWLQETESRYRRLVLNLIRLMRADGSLVLTPVEGKANSDQELLEAAVQLSGAESPLAAKLLKGAKRQSQSASAKTVGKRSLLAANAHSEWAGLAVLRRGWERSDPRLAVDYHDQPVQLELACGDEVFWSGAWGLDVRRDGQPLEIVSPWEEICWYSDEQMDYLEIEAKLTGGVRVQRHLALAHEDDFVFLADSLLGAQPAHWEYRAWLPVAAGVGLEPAEETRECFLQGRRRALALPLALPEWRCDSRSGALEPCDRGLELQQSAAGKAMFAPLLVDLNTRRIQRPFTWRQLTVGENLQAQPADVAVGYRVMAGNQQWLIYRSLVPPGNRTVLGHNLITQLLVARFAADGEVTALVEIE